MMSYFKLFALAAISFLAGGLPAEHVPDPEPTDTTYGSDAVHDRRHGRATCTATVSSWTIRSAGELAMVIYFDFDSSEVRAADQDIVSRHAMQLGNDAAACASKGMPMSAARASTTSVLASAVRRLCVRCC